ncbi:MAG: hypothetical protein IJP20_06135 [Clostridia bacterium]|nr:hypothetical protein [Clostridia bacterium]
MKNVDERNFSKVIFEEKDDSSEIMPLDSNIETFVNSLDKIESIFEEFSCSSKEEIYIDFDKILKCESDLDKWDYCYALAIGIAGVEISTNERFAKFLEGIHDEASETGEESTSLQKMLGKILHHKGDAMDIAEGQSSFVNRGGKNAYGAFHRVFWGHDILDFGEDNPFALMIKQREIGGSLQTVRHLLADTMSKQGLPIPGNSYFDTQGNGDGLSNYLVQISQSLSDEAYGSKGKANQIFSHLFSIRAQDFTAGIMVKTFTQLYFLMRDIRDPIRCKEIELIAYTVNFFGEVIKGMIKQNGVPYINIPVASKMIGTLGRFIYLNEVEDYKLSTKTNFLINRTKEIVNYEKEYADLMPKINESHDLCTSLDTNENNFKELLDFLNEGQ